MKSVRKFFGRLCGSSGRQLDGNKGESPVSPPKENEEKRQIEPTLLPDDAQSRGDKDETLKEYFTQSSYESLNESPKFRKKQTALKATYSTHCIYDVAEWKPESLGTQSTDKLFSDAAELMEPFFKQTHNLSSLLLKFARQYSKEKKPDFFKCYQVYLKNKATDGLNNTSNHSESNIMNISDDDLKDPTVKQLKEVAMNGTTLLQLIDTIKPQVVERLDEAGKYDVKEAVKEKKSDSVGQQTGLLSKLSTPGKFRRNLKQLKENHKLLGLVHSEVESIVLIITEKGVKAKAVAASNQEMERTGNPTLLSTVAVDDPSSQNDVIIDSLQVQSCDTPVEIGTDENEGAHNDVRKLIEDQQTLVVEENPEVIDEKKTVDIGIKPASHQEDFQKNEINQLNDADVVNRELVDKVLPLKSDSSAALENQASSSSQDNVDFGRLLDFGSYIVVDPSVSDEVMLRGSRSLDSLCSVSSRRTLSKYGSYEFVTDFELKIAEKAENQRQQFT